MIRLNIRSKARRLPLVCCWAATPEEQFLESAYYPEDRPGAFPTSDAAFDIERQNIPAAAVTATPIDEDAYRNQIEREFVERNQMGNDGSKPPLVPATRMTSEAGLLAASRAQKKRVMTYGLIGLAIISSGHVPVGSLSSL